MFKKENIKSVCAQQARWIGMYDDLKFNYEEYSKEEIARQIGVEMMKNNLIEFTITNENGYIITRAAALVYDKNEKSEK